MRENELIAAVRARIRDPEGVIGIGDDCCVWTPSGPTCLSTDTIVEGRHFTQQASPAQVGRKAAGAALSDLAAMGAIAKGAVVAITCPSRWDSLAIMDGLIAELQRHHCPLLGGDTTGGETLSLTVTVWGEAAHGRFLYRSGGKPGDLLVVTGPLGGSLASGRHLAPEPRFAEGAWLAGHPAVRACMDISDGLAADAEKLARASGGGCLLLPTQIPVHPDVPEMSDTIAAAMQDGEDYELLAAVSPEHWPNVQLAWPFDNPLCVVGWLIEQNEMQMEDHRGRVVPLAFRGYEHT